MAQFVRGPITARPTIARRHVVADVDMPWDFVPQTCSHTLLVRRDDGRYSCEVCPAELVLRPLRARGRR